MRVSALIVLAAGAIAYVIVAPVYGADPALGTAGLVAGLSAAGLAAARFAALDRPRPATLRRRFSLAIGVAVGVILAAVGAGAELMFVSNHDALMITAIVVAVGLVALRAARVASAGVVRDVERLRDALRAVGEGERARLVKARAASELGELAAAANRMTEQLAAGERGRDAADAARRNLVAAVSHDLRTPIASLRLLVEAIEDDIVDEPTRRRYLATMHTHLAALGSLIDDLFELSRLEAGDLEWSIQQVEIAELLDETVAALRIEAETKGVAVKTELADPLGPARGDPEKLQRVLFNLIQNAIRHTPADGSVTVRAEPAAGAVEIEVADTGDGIPREDRGRVFEAFVRGDPSRPSGGAGLGLAISRAIVEGHGGRIWLPDSERGTRVRFSLPA
jgi:signal transduction histidine kinase